MRKYLHEQGKIVDRWMRDMTVRDITRARLLTAATNLSSSANTRNVVKFHPRVPDLLTSLVILIGIRQLGAISRYYPPGAFSSGQTSRTSICRNLNITRRCLIPITAIISGSHVEKLRQQVNNVLFAATIYLRLNQTLTASTIESPQ